MGFVKKKYKNCRGPRLDISPNCWFGSAPSLEKLIRAFTIPSDSFVRKINSNLCMPYLQNKPRSFRTRLESKVALISCKWVDRCASRRKGI